MAVVSVIIRKNGLYRIVGSFVLTMNVEKNPCIFYMNVYNGQRRSKARHAVAPRVATLLYRYIDRKTMRHRARQQQQQSVSVYTCTQLKQSDDNSCSFECLSRLLNASLSIKQTRYPLFVRGYL